MASLGHVEDSSTTSMTQVTGIGGPAFQRIEYPYNDNPIQSDLNDTIDSSADGPFGENPFGEPFIPGLWDFFPLSPVQAPQPLVALNQPTVVQEDTPSTDSREIDSSTVTDFEHPWPMEWNPGSVQPLSLPLLKDIQHNKKTAMRIFCNPISSAGLTTLKDRIRLYYGYGPWQQIDLENFPGPESLNHAIDMYFVHFHAVRPSDQHYTIYWPWQVLPMIHHPTFNPENNVIVTLCLVTVGVKYTAFSGAQVFSKALSELIRRLVLSRVGSEVFKKTARTLTQE
jgi:hypothetical protein